MKVATTTPQAGILPEPDHHALFLVVRVKDPSSVAKAASR